MRPAFDARALSGDDRGTLAHRLCVVKVFGAVSFTKFEALRTVQRPADAACEVRCGNCTRTHQTAPDWHSSPVPNHPQVMLPVDSNPY